MRRLQVLLVAVLLLALGCGSTRGGASAVAADRDQSAAAIDRLLDLLAQRLAIMPLVAKAKWNAALPVEDVARERGLLDGMRDRARSRGLPEAWVEAVFRAQIEAGKDVQRALIARWNAEGAPAFADAPDLRGELRPRIDALNDAILDALGEVAPVLDRRAVQARSCLPFLLYAGCWSGGAVTIQGTPNLSVSMPKPGDQKVF